MLEMSIDSIRVSLMNYQRVVILRVKDTDRYLPIWIGPSEADSIALKLQDVSVPRPMTHDLLEHVIHHLDANLERIVVTDLRDSTFFAKLILRRNGESLEVDSRPSDAIALAVRVGASIFVSEEVLDAAGIEPDDEDVFSGGVDSEPAVTDEQLKPFRDFINQLDLDDLGHD